MGYNDVMGWRFWKRKKMHPSVISGEIPDDGHEGLHKLSHIVLLTVVYYVILTVIVGFILYELTK